MIEVHADISIRGAGVDICMRTRAVWGHTLLGKIIVFSLYNVALRPLQTIQG